jgi:PAT family beta-lactamase induction signal transducer AmpG
MYVSGGLSITLAAQYSWPLVNLCLALLYFPMLVITWKAPEAEEHPVAPTTLRAAIWYPFLGVFRRSRALEILAFVACYKLADNLAGALLRPFLIDLGYSAFDRGVALATVGLTASLAGTFIGGVLTTFMGLGHSLWAFGFLQIFSNGGYILLAEAGFNRPLMYSAMAFESVTQGMGTGAFAVLLLRLTQKRFSATQYALFSSLFGLPRLVAGPLSGFLVDALGWKMFFWITIVAGIPGMLLLHRFAPLGVREVSFTVDKPRALSPLSTSALAWRGVCGTLAGILIGATLLAVLGGLSGMKAVPGGEFRFLAALGELVQPVGIVGWIQLAGLLVLALASGLVTAALSAAQRGEPDLSTDDELECADPDAHHGGSYHAIWFNSGWCDPAWPNATSGFQRNIGTSCGGTTLGISLPLDRTRLFESGMASRRVACPYRSRSAWDGVRAGGTLAPASPCRAGRADCHARRHLQWPIRAGCGLGMARFPVPGL